MSIFSDKFPRTVSVQRSDTVIQSMSEDELLASPMPPPPDLRPMSEYYTLRTGTGLPFLHTYPEYNWSRQMCEPIEVPPDGVLEDCLKREAERVANPDSMINLQVYDCIDPSPFQLEPLEIHPYYCVSSPTDRTLTFESRFESGNLRRAIQIYEFEYDLILKPDYNTKGNTQWFFFNVSNTRKNVTYRFNIINMMKPDSLYNYGMKPCVYSQKDAAKGWHRNGDDICYYMNTIKKKQGGNFYTLSFTLEFAHDFDTVSIAHCYPYTYTDLCNYIKKLFNDPKKRNRLKKRVLCNTMAGNACDVLTITSFTGGPEAIKRRRGVVLMARVHPGESNASWMMKGILDYITGPSLDAKILRENFVFKIIPMLNPDGVINGSYRCGLAGVDLNRCWIDPSPRFNPTIYFAKELIKQFNKENNLIMACDFHGHSRKKNIFMYGCIGKNKIRERIFPKLMEKSSEIFSFSDCAFGIQKAKEATARIVIYKELGIINSYTLESSFCGADYGRYQGYHFNVQHLLDIGHDFCDALLDYCDPDQTRVRQVIEEIDNMLNLAIESDEEEEPVDEKTEEDPNKKKPPKKKKAISKKKSFKKSK